jgi:hypothetical protein
LARWMSRMPADMTRNVTLMLPGVAHDESTDSDAFDCRNAPGFFLSSSDWSTPTTRGTRTATRTTRSTLTM